MQYIFKNTPVLVALISIFLGNDVVQNFQDQAWKGQERLDHENEIRKEAIRYFETLSDLMDERLYSTRQYFWSIGNNTNKTREDSKKDVEKIKDEWNKQLNKNIVKVNMYFENESKYVFDPTKCQKHCNQDNKQLCECLDESREICRKERKTKRWTAEYEFECEIHLNFRCIYDKTLKEYKNKNKENKKNEERLKTLVGDQINCLNERIYQFDRYILNSVINKSNKREDSWFEEIIYSVFSQKSEKIK